MADIQQHEEAARALELGKKAVDAGQWEKAIKMLEKSIRMRKTVEAETLLTCAKKGQARAQAKTAAPEPVTPNGHGFTAPAASSSPAPADARPFTKEQEEACHVIIRSKTHYETLSIERTANADEIKKAYRKLALKFHPDKNSAPNADEAFKKISKAFKILLDPDERAHYDRYGDREEVAPGRSHQHGGFQQHAGFDDMDADEFLRFFMGGFGPNVRVHQFGGARRGGFGPGAHYQNRGNGAEASFSIQSLLSLFIMFVFLLSSWTAAPDSSSASRNSGATTAYSLFPDKQHSILRKTSMHGVVSDIPYYVDPRFASTIGRSPRDLYYVERDVESSLHQTLKEKCLSETTFKAQELNRARASGDKRALDAATKMDTPTCTRQHEFEKKRRK
jgi:curved DNA-binding protein CbpA